MGGHVHLSPPGASQLRASCIMPVRFFIFLRLRCSDPTHFVVMGPGQEGPQAPEVKDWCGDQSDVFEPLLLAFCIISFLYHSPPPPGVRGAGKCSPSPSYPRLKAQKRAVSCPRSPAKPGLKPGLILNSRSCHFGSGHFLLLTWGLEGRWGLESREAWEGVSSKGSEAKAVNTKGPGCNPALTLSSPLYLESSATLGRSFSLWCLHFSIPATRGSF